jgi:molybdopterin converting factor small subunit
MPSVTIPTTMRRFTENQRTLTLPGGSVAQVLRALAERYPKAFSQVCDDQGEMKAFVAIFVNDTDIRMLAGPETALQETDEVHIIPAIAGGAGG